VVALVVVVLAGGLLGGACDSAAGTDTAAATSAGPLAVERPLRDFGEVWEGAVLEHEWTVAVREDLALNEPSTDCGCTLALLEREGPSGRAPYAPGDPLAAGDRLHLRVEYDTRGRQGPSGRKVVLTSPSGASLLLRVEADVRPWLVAEPQRLAFERVREGEGAEREILVRSASGEPFGLVATRRALPDWVEVTPTPEGGDGTRAPVWRVRVRLLADAPRGTYGYPIELVSDVHHGGSSDGGTRAHAVAPTWPLQVVGPVALSTPSLDFGVVHPDEVVSRTLRLEGFEPGFSLAAAGARLEPLRSGSATGEEGEPPFLLQRTARVRVLPERDGAREIEVTLDGLDPELQGSFLARLVVDTGHPAIPRLEALVRGVRLPDGGVR